MLTEKTSCPREVPPSCSAMVEVILYRDRNRTGGSADTTSTEGADLPLFTRIASYERATYIDCRVSKKAEAFLALLTKI